LGGERKGRRRKGRIKVMQRRKTGTRKEE